MTPKVFCRLAIGLVGTPVEWKTRLAHRLDRPVADIEAWATGTTRVPAAVAAALVHVASHDDGPRDEWIRGDGLAPTNAPPRDYLVHARAPRFIARVAHAEEEAATNGDGRLAEIVWLDPEPDDEDRDGLMDAAAAVLERSDSRL